MSTRTETPEAALSDIETRPPVILLVAVGMSKVDITPATLPMVFW